MEINKLKEQILESKLSLYKIQQEKNEIIKRQLYERAANLRELEKQVKEHFENLKCEVLKEIDKFKEKQSDLNDYVLLQSLLFEFHSVEFQNDCMHANSIEAINNYVNSFWKIRDQMHDELMKYLFEEYKYLREQMHQFKSESDDDKARRALNRLTSISDLILRHKP